MFRLLTTSVFSLILLGCNGDQEESQRPISNVPKIEISQLDFPLFELSGGAVNVGINYEISGEATKKSKLFNKTFTSDTDINEYKNSNNYTVVKKQSVAIKMSGGVSLGKKPISFSSSLDMNNSVSRENTDKKSSINEKKYYSKKEAEQWTEWVTTNIEKVGPTSGFFQTTFDLTNYSEYPIEITDVKFQISQSVQTGLATNQQVLVSSFLSDSMIPGDSFPTINQTTSSTDVPRILKVVGAVNEPSIITTSAYLSGYPTDSILNIINTDSNLEAVITDYTVKWKGKEFSYIELQTEILKARQSGSFMRVMAPNFTKWYFVPFVSSQVSIENLMDMIPGSSFRKSETGDVFIDKAFKINSDFQVLNSDDINECSLTKGSWKLIRNQISESSMQPDFDLVYFTQNDLLSQFSTTREYCLNVSEQRDGTLKGEMSDGSCGEVLIGNWNSENKPFDSTLISGFKGFSSFFKIRKVKKPIELEKDPVWCTFSVNENDRVRINMAGIGHNLSVTTEHKSLQMPPFFQDKMKPREQKLNYSERLITPEELVDDVYAIFNEGGNSWSFREISNLQKNPFYTIADSISEVMINIDNDVLIGKSGLFCLGIEPKITELELGRTFDPVSLQGGGASTPLDVNPNAWVDHTYVSSNRLSKRKIRSARQYRMHAQITTPFVPYSCPTEINEQQAESPRGPE